MAAPKSPLQDAIDRLVKREPRWKAFDRKHPVGAAVGGRAVGRPGGATGASGGSGFDEFDAAQREYYPARILTSSDGIFQISWEPIKSILLQGDVRATFKEPPQ